MNKFCNALFLLVFVNFKASCQIKATMLKIDDNYQSCMDSGVNMYGCTVAYFRDMDSMLNVTYKMIRINLPQADKNALGKKQLIWLKKRDREYIRINSKPNIEGINNSDNLMIKLRAKAIFINDRIYELIKNYELK